MGGGIGMGNTCKPMANSFQCMTKFTTNLKKKKKRISMVEILIEENSFNYFIHLSYKSMILNSILCSKLLLCLTLFSVQFSSVT